MDKVKRFLANTRYTAPSLKPSPIVPIEKFTRNLFTIAYEETTEMRTTTKEQVKEAFNSLPPLSYISVIYGKGKDRTYKGFDLHKRREDTIGRLIMLLSEKSLTHNLTSIGYMKGWMNCPERIEVRLTESKKAILNSNIDADMLQAIMDCVNEIDERARNWNWGEWNADDLGMP